MRRSLSSVARLALAGAFVLGVIVSFSHSSGTVLPCTTMR